MTNPVSLAVSEHEIQSAYFDWVKAQRLIDERFKLIHANPNAGKRSFATANYMRREGLEKGVPDIDIDVPSGQWTGAHIEAKKPGGKLSPEQVEQLELLKRVGRRACFVCYSTEEMIEVTQKYLG